MQTGKIPSIHHEKDKDTGKEGRKGIMMALCLGETHSGAMLSFPAHLFA